MPRVAGGSYELEIIDRWGRRHVELDRAAHDRAGHFTNLPHKQRSQGDAPPVGDQLDGKEAPVAPAASLARLRKQVLDLVVSKRMKVRENRLLPGIPGVVAPRSWGQSGT